MRVISAGLRAEKDAGFGSHKLNLRRLERGEIRPPAEASKGGGLGSRQSGSVSPWVWTAFRRQRGIGFDLKALQVKLSSVQGLATRTGGFRGKGGPCCLKRLKYGMSCELPMKNPSIMA